MGVEGSIIKYFGVSAKVEGDFIIKEPVVSHHNGFQVSITPVDGEYRISTIRKIDEASPLQLNKLIDKPDTIHIPEDSLYSEYLTLLKHIEAIGGYHYGINKIHLRDTLELAWYEGEVLFQNLNKIFSIERSYTPTKKHLLTTSNLSSILLLYKVIPDALIPYNYFREANQYLQSEDYRLAYLHFYMLLEYCFADGKMGIKEQTKSFLENDDYILALLQTIKLFKTHSPNNFEKINKDVVDFDKRKNQKKMNYEGVFSIETTTKLLFDYRGQLAHGTGRSEKYVFDDSVLKNITLFISSICFSVCGNMQVYASAFTNKKNDFVTNNIKNLKAELNL